MTWLRRWGRSGFLCLAMFALAACSDGQPASPLPSAGAEGELPAYHVGSGDRIIVKVFRHEDLSGEYELDGRGRFGMPLIGEIDASGLDVRHLEEAIEERLKDGFLVDPQVNVEVLNYREFFIYGEVGSPSSYEYAAGMTVIKAVTMAGGFSYRASQSGITIRRGGSNQPAVPARLDTVVLPGDIIEVPERFF